MQLHTYGQDQTRNSAGSELRQASSVMTFDADALYEYT